MTLDTRAYTRVSDPRQATEDKVSLGVQLQALERLAGQLGRTLVAEAVYQDAGVSGGTANRPAFQRLIKDCTANPCPKKDGLVLVYRDDRWGRFEDPDEAGHWTWLIGQAGWRVRFAQMDSDNDEVTPFLRTIGRLSGRAERRKIQDRSRIGMRGAIERGCWINREPFGYLRVAIDKLTGARRTLAPGQRKGENESLKLTAGPQAEVDLVIWLFTAYASGTVSLEELRHQAGERYPKPWHYSTIQRMLRNPVYVGDIESGRRRGEAVVIRDAFPGLVDRDLWQRVQDTMARNRRETSPVRYAYPLSGLFTCATCGHPFVGGGRAGPRAPDDPMANWFYRDSGPAKTGCPGHLMTFLRREVEPLVLDGVAQVIDKHDLAPRLRAAFDRILATTDDVRERRQAELHQSKQSIEAKRGRLVAAVADGTLQRSEANPQLQQIRADLDRITSELDRARFDVCRQARLTAERDRLVAMAMDFRATAESLEGPALRELLRPWIASGVVDKNDRVLTLKIRTVPAMPTFDSFTASAGPAGEAATVTLTIRLKSRSDWARLREAEKRRKRNQVHQQKPQAHKRPA